MLGVKPQDLRNDSFMDLKCDFIHSFKIVRNTYYESANVLGTWDMNKRGGKSLSL